jgi:hypothetical protein
VCGRGCTRARLTSCCQFLPLGQATLERNSADMGHTPPAQDWYSAQHNTATFKLHACGCASHRRLRASMTLCDCLFGLRVRRLWPCVHKCDAAERPHMSGARSRHKFKGQHRERSWPDSPPICDACFTHANSAGNIQIILQSSHSSRLTATSSTARAPDPLQRKGRRPGQRYELTCECGLARNWPQPLGWRLQLQSSPATYHVQRLQYRSAGCWTRGKKLIGALGPRLIGTRERLACLPRRGWGRGGNRKHGATAEAPSGYAVGNRGHEARRPQCALRGGCGEAQARAGGARRAV